MLACTPRIARAVSKHVHARKNGSHAPDHICCHNGIDDEPCNDIYDDLHIAAPAIFASRYIPAALYFRSYAAAAAKFGHEYSFDGVHYALLGRPEPVGAQAFLDILKIEGVTPEQLLEIRDETLIAEMPSVTPTPGAVATVASFAGKIPTAIATSSLRSYLELKARNNADLFNHVDQVLCGNDAVMAGKPGKPHPFIFLEAAKLIGVEPSKCVAFEDSVAGVQSAKAAGMFTIVVPDARIDPAEMAAAKPDLVLQSLEHFDCRMVGIAPS